MYLGIVEFIVFILIFNIVLFVIATIQKWYYNKHFKIGDGDIPKEYKSPMFDTFMNNDKDKSE